MQISLTTFDTWLPALRTPQGDIFKKMQAALQRVAADPELTAMEPYCTEGDLPAALEKLICYRAAYDSIASLDLVATPTGFGIVSNQNTAPASKERVAALKEELREMKCYAWESLLQQLLDTEWAKTRQCADLLCCNLFFAPYLLRRSGVTLDGRKILEEEYEQMQTSLHAAADSLEALISPALHERLSRLQYESEEDEKSMAVAIVALERSRRYMAACLMRGNPKALHSLARDLLDYIRLHAEAFPEYTASTEYAAQTAPRYENEQQHPTFFF